MTPGQRIKNLRVSNNLDEQSLSEELGYKTDSTIHKWEANIFLPNGRDLKKLALFFEVSVDYLLGLDDRYE